MGHRLWLIGGTQESRWLGQRMLAQAVPAASRLSPDKSIPRPILVTVTTESARQLYADYPVLDCWVGQLTPEQGEAFILDQDIGAVLDASHPFATAISQLAIALAQQYRLPYLRYERPAIAARPALTWQTVAGQPGNVTLPALADVFAGEYLVNQRTLLTLGYRHLAPFQPWQTRGTLFVRILPSVPALTAALAAGFTPDRIIALRPPIRAALEKALWQQWQITQVITKASGQAGGEDQKQAIAADLGIRLIRLARPTVTYPRVTESLQTAVDFATRFFAATYR